MTGDIFTVTEAAKYLRCGPKTIRRLVRIGRLPHRKIDRKGTIRIHKKALDAFVLGEKESRA